ncbi:major facilitator superfamily domain-containing protein [Xylariaceae sp. FL1272]|nr:major facilitator superfamily domain-containing protein [Xylariaceae sp. FL1272]
MSNPEQHEQDISVTGIARKEHSLDAKDSPEDARYSSITSSKLKLLQLLLGIATITSPLTATIYFPLLPLLHEHFHASAQAINLTLTIYIIFQGISPALFGPLSDFYGRRPLFLVTLLLYAIGNVGLALNQRNYAALLVLRAIQSLGASAAYAISFGVVADVCPPSERGRMLGPISMALNLGACIGPVAGGAVAYKSGSYEWVFWALVIVGFVLFACVGAFLPETARSLVGSGEEPSRYKWWQLSWIGLIRQHLRNCRPRGKETESPSRRHDAQGGLKKGYSFANFLAAFRIIFHRDTILILWMHGSFYVVDYAFVAALPDIYADYHFNELEIGLAYLPRGVGIIIGSYFTGKLMDHNYSHVSRRVGWSGDKATGNDLFRFPIELSRTRFSYWMLAISTATMIGYGWTVYYRAHFSISLVLQFSQGFWGTYFYTTYSALLVDSFPQSPSTAAATTSITRTLMAAAGVAILEPIIKVAGRGWYFTVLGLWSGLFGIVAVFLLRWRGMAWRRMRNCLNQCDDDSSA